MLNTFYVAVRASRSRHCVREYYEPQPEGANKATEWGKLLLQPAEELSHPAGSFIDILLGYRIRDTDVLSGTEGLAGDSDHVSLVEQARGQLSGGANASLAQKGRDVRVDVESALGLGAGDAGELAQLGQHVVPQINEFGTELRHAFLRAGQRGNCRLLHHACSIRRGLRLQFAQIGYHRLRRQRISGTPAGHGIGLR